MQYSQNHGQLNEEIGACDCAVEKLTHQLVIEQLLFCWTKYVHVICPIHNSANGYIEEMEQKGGNQLPPRSDVFRKLEKHSAQHYKLYSILWTTW